MQKVYRCLFFLCTAAQNLRTCMHRMYGRNNNAFRSMGRVETELTALTMRKNKVESRLLLFLEEI